MCEKCNKQNSDCECNLTYVQQNTDNVFFGIDISDNLPNLNLSAGTDLTSIIKKIDYRLGNITNSANYAAFNLGFLYSKYTVNTVKKFSESVDLELSYNNARVNNLFTVIGNQENNTLNFEKKINSINIPSIIDSSAIGFTVNDNINTVLQQIVNKFNTIPILKKSPVFSSTDTKTVNITLSGINNSNISSDVKISNVPNNKLKKYDDGLYVANLATNGNQTLKIDGNQLTISGGNTIPIPISGLQTLQRIGNKIYISGGNDITLPDTIETSLVANSSTSINFIQTGITGHNITGAVKISSVSGNKIIIKDDGIYVKMSASDVLNQISTDSDLKNVLCGLVSNCLNSVCYRWYIRNTSTNYITIKYVDINGVSQSQDWTGLSQGTIDGLKFLTFPSNTLTITFLGSC